MITRAGFPAKTTLSPKDLVTTEPAPTTTLSPKVTPGKIVTPPPAQKLSPIVIGAPYSKPELRSSGSKGCKGVNNCTLGPSIAFFPIRIGQTSSIVQLKLA